MLNIFCGFRSLLHTAEGDYILASWFIILAGIFDVLDGVMARITKSSSEFGVEFDSLSDVVSFGVAPSFLAYAVQLHNLDGIGMLLSAMPMIFGALRLARFNAQLVGYEKEYFKGLPIPAAAIMIASFVLTFYHPGIELNALESSIFSPMVFMLSLLMVSTLKYDAVPKFTRRGIKQHPLRFTIVVAGFTAIIFTQGRFLFPFFVFYTATGPIRYVAHAVVQAVHPSEKNVDEKDTEITGVDV
jgi:CDP-diacylglycerol--serine O-phosphatidyltransferase